MPFRVVRPATRSVVALLLTGAASHAAAQTRVPLRETREELRIASSDSVPGILLTPVASGAVLPDGRILTVHLREAIVRVFGPDGRLITRLGGKGSGPGEFRIPRLVGYFGDTLWVSDMGLNRYQMFDVAYKPAGVAAAIGTGGMNLGMTSGSTSLFQKSVRDSVRKIAIYDRAGAIRAPIGIALRDTGHRFNVREAVIDPSGVLTGATRMQVTNSPLRAYTSIALMPGSREAMVLESAKLWGGKPGQLTVRRIQLSTGRISPPVVVSLTARTISSTEADSIIERAGQRSPRVAAQLKAGARVPPFYPAFRDWIVGNDGALWLTEYADPETWIAIDPSGKPVMRVRTPAGLVVVAVSPTHLWGILRDADDLPIILRYRITQ